MTAILEQAVAALRDELQQCGEMLALLEAQREAAVSRGADAALTSCPPLAAQAVALGAARVRRETCQRALGQSLAQGGQVPFLELIPLLPENFRPLVVSLVQENVRLLRQIREQAAENHLLLCHSLEAMQQFIDSLSSPDASALLGEETEPFTAATDEGPSHPAAA